MQVIYDKNNQKVPIYTWAPANKIESGALDQAKNLSNLPFAFKHVALMPDVHQGYGMPIGGVLATNDVVVPNAVGVDIGCGMCALPTNIHKLQLDKNILEKIVEEIYSKVPVGKKHFIKPKPLPSNLLQSFKDKNLKIAQQERDNIAYQIGTLGGGNHFIEIQYDENDRVWIMLHSGSRNLGKKVADYYNKLAIELNKKWKSNIPKHYQLNFLPIDSEEGRAYIDEMNFCIDFALENRKRMLERVVIAMEIHIPHLDVNFEEDMINIAHNYAALENHFGKNVLVHRKGATLARKGKIGIIPGSQGTNSYIVEGLGNPKSFMSCSHGAGRIMSRSKAREILNLEEEKEKLESRNIVHRLETEKDLDEAPSAYKDIDEVMENQKDLVKILHKLTPLAVVKG